MRFEGSSFDSEFCAKNANTESPRILLFSDGADWYREDNTSHASSINLPASSSFAIAAPLNATAEFDLIIDGEYGFFDNKLAVGVLSTTRFLEPKAVSELTFSANYRPKSWFNVALSYSAIQSAGKSFGAALKVGSFFIGTDYMFLGKNSNSVNGFLGVSIPLGGKKI